MKKVVCLAAVLFAATLAFGEVFPNADKMVEDFFTRGKYIKIVKDGNNIVYFPKAGVCGINIDEDDMEIATIGYNIWTGENGDAQSYNVKKWDFSGDTDGNIILIKK